MSVWDVAKQASSVVTMALQCRYYGFLICRMWFNKACHILFWSLSAGLLLMVTTTDEISPIKSYTEICICIN